MELREARQGDNPTMISVLSVGKVGGVNLMPRHTANELSKRKNAFLNSDDAANGAKLRIVEDGFRLASPDEVRHFIQMSNEQGRPLPKLPTREAISAADRERQKDSEIQRLKAELEAAKLAAMAKPEPEPVIVIEEATEPEKPKRGRRKTKIEEKIESANAEQAKSEGGIE